MENENEKEFEITKAESEDFATQSPEQVKKFIAEAEKDAFGKLSQTLWMQAEIEAHTNPDLADELLKSVLDELEKEYPCTAYLEEKTSKLIRLVKNAKILMAQVAAETTNSQHHKNDIIREYNIDFEQLAKESGTAYKIINNMHYELAHLRYRLTKRGE